MKLFGSNKKIAFQGAAAALALVFAVAALVLSRGPVPSSSAQDQAPVFTNFESPQVHPLTLTPDGTRLLAVNSPNGTLSVFQLTTGTPVLTAEIPVGLEPVSVAARDDREAWVVNWLSDSVSVVDLAAGNVVRTIDVGDEPTDVVFAGVARKSAYVCVAGTNEVKVFDPANTSAPPQVIPIFGKQPRSLARNGAGTQVFVSVFESGSQTTVVPFNQVTQAGGPPPPSPALAQGLPPAPAASLIVKWNGTAWADETGDTKWNQFLPYRLADIDLVKIDAGAATPAVTQRVKGVGTHIGNAVFDASRDRLFVLNLESLNVERFEPNLRGRFQNNRVSAITFEAAGAQTTAVDLNPHVDFSRPDGSDAERRLSLSLPMDIVRATDGTMYVSANGNARVGVLDSQGQVQSRIEVGEGPTGLALDGRRAQLYVLNRFEQSVSVVDTAARAERTRVPVGFNPEPEEVRAGRRFLYDGNFSSHGTVSCASCHQFGNRDGIVWDLGDPRGTLAHVGPFEHHPMKGPMNTQTLRGIIGTEPFHWRGDRENLAAFNVAFTNLQGAKRQLTDEEMTAFEAFVRTLAFPPNPNENLDRTFPDPPTGPSAKRGSQLFQVATLGGITCNTCHTTFPGHGPGTEAILFPGSIFPEPQVFKVGQLRGLYQKTGMSRQPGEHITGFGFLHDGRFESVFSFLRLPTFSFRNDDERRDVEAFLMSFDTGTAPAVGLQVTINAETRGTPAAEQRLRLLAAQADALNCDVVARGLIGGRIRNYLRLGNGTFRPDRQSEQPVTLEALVQSASGTQLTFTGVPPGEGARFSIDRNNDGVPDGDAAAAAVSISGRVVDQNNVGVAGVTVRLEGSQAGAAETDSAGNFVFNLLRTNGSYTVRPVSNNLAFGPATQSFDNPPQNQTANFTATPRPFVANPIDDAAFFVRQHYLDFLNREPDAAGLAFWRDQLLECGADAVCVEARRVNISAAFYLSIEFQETGFYVYRAHQLGSGAGPTLPLETFLQDARQVGDGIIVGQGDWRQRLTDNKRLFAEGFVARAQFLAQYPLTLTPEEFVAALDARAGGALSAAEKTALADGLRNGSMTRAAVLRAVIEDPDFVRNEFNRAFVLMQYFGYLRRNPAAPPDSDLTGFNFWLQKLNDFNGNFIAADMVKAFLNSDEYRNRFIPQ